MPNYALLPIYSGGRQLYIEHKNVQIDGRGGIGF
jgi:hypothetical protein